MREREGTRFGWVSIINHWSVAIVFIFVLSLGFILDYFGSGRALRGPWMGVHQATGVLFLVLALWRISWRYYQGFPEDVAPMPAWQHWAAKLVHWLLLFAIVAMPVSGMLLSVFGDRAVNVFGLFTLSPQPENELINRIAYGVHGTLAYIVAAGLFMHVGAVLKHHVIDKDDTLRRMLGLKKR